MISFVFISVQDLFASTGETFGVSARNIAIGNANNLTDPGSYAAKENPATMTGNKNGRFAFSYLETDLNLKQTNPVPTTSNESGITRDTYNAASAGNLRNIGFGITIPIGTVLSFGLAGLIPADGFASIHAFTGNEVYYLLYDDRAQRPELYSALAIKLPGFDFISIGTGIFYSLKASGTVQLGVSSKDANARMMMRLDPVFIPYVGLSYSKDTLDFGFFYRAEQKTNADINFDINFDVGLGTIPFSGVSSLVAFYDPSVISFGGGYHLDDHGMYGGIKRSFWSSYKPPIINLSGKDIQQLTDGVTGARKVTLDDTWSLSAGYEKRNLFVFTNFSIAGRAGFAWHESALPDNPTSLAVVDTARTVISIGNGFNFERLGKWFNKPLSFDLAVQYSMLNEKAVSIYEYGNLVQTAQMGDNIWTLVAGVDFEF